MHTSDLTKSNTTVRSVRSDLTPAEIRLRLAILMQVAREYAGDARLDRPNGVNEQIQALEGALKPPAVVVRLEAAEMRARR